MRHESRVLVVDDDENILSAFKDFFRNEHCSMIAATNADEALNVLSREKVHLVITDVRMKWQSGITLCLKVKQMVPHLPVIMITGYPNLISEKDARVSGADFYFLKPLELDQFRHAVRACLHPSPQGKA